MVKKLIMPFALALACVLLNAGCDEGTSEMDSQLLLGKGSINDSFLSPSQPAKSICPDVQPYNNSVAASWVQQDSAQCGPTSFYMIFKYYEDHLSANSYYDDTTELIGLNSEGYNKDLRINVTYLSQKSSISIWLGIDDGSVLVRSDFYDKISVLKNGSDLSQPHYTMSDRTYVTDQLALSDVSEKSGRLDYIIDNYLSKGYPVIIHLERVWYKSGHFVILAGYEEKYDEYGNVDTDNSEIIYMDPNLDKYEYENMTINWTDQDEGIGVPANPLLRVTRKNFLEERWYRSEAYLYVWNDVRAWWDGIFYGFIPAGTPQVVIPAAPSGLSATAASSAQINLSWIDNSSNETGFRIERSSDGGSTYSLIDTTAAGATSYTNANLSAGTTYHYRICAYNSAGNSAYSNVASATTQAASSVATATYTFSGITPTDEYNNAYENDVDQFPFGGDPANRNDHTEGTSARYTAISASDNSRWSTDDPGSYDEMMFWVEMLIEEDAASITQIDFKFEGYPSETGTVEIWVLKAGTNWKTDSYWATDSNWVKLGSKSISSGSDGTLTCSLTENFANYIQSDNTIIWIVGAPEGHSDSLYIDYVEMAVEYME